MFLASRLDLKKLQPEIFEASRSNKIIKEEINKFKEEGLVGEKGRKIEEEVSLSSSKLAQLEGKFTWLHQAHKDLIKKTNESMNASQPLMMNPLGGNSGINETAFGELKEEIRKLEREISDLTSNFKLSVNDLKIKIGEKVEERNLNELEDQLTTDMDQIIRS